VSLDVGIILLNRLDEKFGRAFDDYGTLLYAFPEPYDLTKVPEEEIKRLGFSHQKSLAIKDLATAFANNEINPAELDQMGNPEAVEYLFTLRGIGRWSAEYVLPRGLGRLDTFPGDDIGAQNNLRRLFNLDHKPGYDEIKQLTARRHPYEGLVYFHLLLNKLHLNGVMIEVIYTIGHSTHPIDEFIQILKAYEIEEVVDVRTIPESRHNPQLNEDTLPEELHKHDIGYTRMEGLGGLRHTSKTSVNTAWRNASFRGYADYMQTPEFSKAIDELIDLGK
jgi:hypothetical protein